MESEVSNPFEVFRALEAFSAPNDAVIEAMRAAGQALIDAVQAIAAAIQPVLEALNSYWYSLPADLRRVIIAASHAGEGVSHTRHAMRARKIGRVVVFLS